MSDLAWIVVGGVVGGVAGGVVGTLVAMWLVHGCSLKGEGQGMCSLHPSDMGAQGDTPTL